MFGNRPNQDPSNKVQVQKVTRASQNTVSFGQPVPSYTLGSAHPERVSQSAETSRMSGFGNSTSRPQPAPAPSVNGTTNGAQSKPQPVSSNSSFGSSNGQVSTQPRFDDPFFPQKVQPVDATHTAQANSPASVPKSQFGKPSTHVGTAIPQNQNAAAQNPTPVNPNTARTTTSAAQSSSSAVPQVNKGSEQPQSSAQQPSTSSSNSSSAPGVEKNVKGFCVPEESLNSENENQSKRAPNPPAKPEKDESALALASSMSSLSLKKIDLSSLTRVLSLEQAKDYFPWIGSFHPEGTFFHPSLPYLAVVYNETGRWRKEHIFFLASNDDLSEQMDWEIRVALFFRKYKNKRNEVYKCLMAIPKDEAMVIIGLRTAQLLHEVVLAPTPECDLANVKISSTIEKIDEWLTHADKVIREKVEEAGSRCEDIQRRLDMARVSEINIWNSLNSMEKLLIDDLAKARILLWQLKTRTVSFSRYTGLVHVRTTVWEPSFREPVKFSHLVEHSPIFFQSTFAFIGSEVQRVAQYQIFEKFFKNVLIDISVDGEQRTLEFEAVLNLDSMIPFETFVPADQINSPAQQVRSLSQNIASFYFVAPPTPITKSKKYYSIEGIASVSPRGLSKNASFRFESSAISFGELVNHCTSCFCPDHTSDKCLSSTHQKLAQKKA